MSYTKQEFLHGQIVTAENLNHMEDGIIAAGNVYNLLDNSDFSNPVNQRGIPMGTTQTLGTKIDRWKYNVSGTASDAYFGIVDHHYISILPPSDGYAELCQNLERYNAMKGKTYTFAMQGTYRGENVRWARSFVMGGESAGATLTADRSVLLYSVDTLHLLIRVFGNVGTRSELTLSWAALYEGEYTVDSLPEYVPKGYAEELAECKRYFQNVVLQVPNIAMTAQTRAYFVPFDGEMRVAPTITLKTAIERNNWTQTNAATTVNASYTYGCRIYAQVDAESGPAFWLDVRVLASADL